MSNFAYRVLRQLAPGPFTFVLPATRLVPELLLHRKREVGLRIPDAPVARALVEGPRPAAGHHHRHGAGRAALMAGGRRASRGSPCADATEVRDVYGHALAQVLDAGPLPGDPSTVLSLMGDSIEVLRQGAGVVAGL